MPYPWGFPGGSGVKENPPANTGDAGDAGSIPRSGRSPGWGNGNPFQYSCLENPMDRETWQTTVHKVAQSQTWLRMHTHAGAISKQKLLERLYGSFFFFFVSFPSFMETSFQNGSSLVWIKQRRKYMDQNHNHLKVSSNRITESTQRLCNTKKRKLSYF